MIKPYKLTGESRYLGLPLGFGFLGLTYALSAFIYAQPYVLGTATLYIQLVVRAFAFVFLVVTYYFSRKSVENTQRFWNATLAVLIVAAFVTSFVLIRIPVVDLPNYSVLSAFVRVFNLVCIAYLCAHTLRSHLEKPDPETIWIPLGYFLFGISQYSLIIYAVDNSMTSWWGALAIRWAGLAVFLIISFRSFYRKQKEAAK